MGELGASCFHTQMDYQRDIEKGQWEIERVGQLCTKPENFANWKIAIIKLCRRNPICEFEVKKEFEQIIDRVQRIKSITDKRDSRIN
jgi:hypothetical protein